MLTPRILLHVEGFAVLALAVYGYARVDGSWLWFAILFLTPDVSMAGYLANERIGATTYNFVHTYVGPLVVLAALLVLDRGDLIWLPTIWIAHIGFDRMMGYGLKYETAFKDTHFQRL